MNDKTYSQLPFPAVGPDLNSKSTKNQVVKPTCSVANCNNGVVQGGRCVTHGAKRPKCKFPGCDKNSKAAGLCSKHGPKRKICSVEGCTKFCIRGSKCRAHAEPSNKCAMKGCRKAAIHHGVCKCHQKEGSSMDSTMASSSSPPPLPAVSQKVVFVPVPMPMFPPSTLGYNPAMFAHFNQHGAASFFNPHANLNGPGQPRTHHTEDASAKNLDGQSTSPRQTSDANLIGFKKPTSQVPMPMFPPEALRYNPAMLAYYNLQGAAGFANPLANCNGSRQPATHHDDDTTSTMNLNGFRKPTSRHTSDASAANLNVNTGHISDSSGTNLEFGTKPTREDDIRKSGNP